METNEPFVIIWRVQAQTPIRVRNECFKRVRVHHPNALAFVVWEDGVSDFSFVDERCKLCEQVCDSDLEGWKMFYEKRVGDSGLLLRDNLFIGLNPFPPFLSNQMLWLRSATPLLFELRNEERVEHVQVPAYLGFIGYLRRSFLRHSIFHMGPDGFALALRGVQVTFQYERPLERPDDLLDDLIRLDVPVLCFIQQTSVEQNTTIKNSSPS